MEHFLDKNQIALQLYTKHEKILRQITYSQSETVSAFLLYAVGRVGTKMPFSFSRKFVILFELSRNLK